MSTAAKTKSPRIPRAKIALELRLLLKGRPFSIEIQKTPLGSSRIVRIVTPAWKTLRPAERIGRVRKAIEPVLSPEELGGIFRFSVLTPSEYETIFGVPPRGGATKAKTVQRLTGRSRTRR